MAPTSDEDPGIALPELGDPRPWLAVVAGLATLRIANAEGPHGSNALCLDYDFGTGAGFVVARRESVLNLPDAWEARLFVRNTGPANTIELKLIDATGASVWRWTSELSRIGSDWTELEIPSRDFVFAWGPAGGGSIRTTSALEIAVVAGPGGAGSIDLAGLRIFDRSPGLGARIEATSRRDGHLPEYAFDDDAATSWQSEPGPGPHALTVHFSAPREIGGVVVAWLPAAIPRSFRIDISESDGARTSETDVVWTTAYESPASIPATSFIQLRSSRARSLRVVATALDAAAGTGVVQIDVRPPEWARTPSEFLTNVALRSRRGAWPRYLLREQTYWTPVATPQSGPSGLLSDDGAVEIGEAGFMLEPSLLLTPASSPGVPAGSPGISAGQWITWADVHRSASIEGTRLPVPTVGWKTRDPLAEGPAADEPDIDLEITAVAEDSERDDVIVVRYRMRSSGTTTLRLTLLVAVRPLQVTPPWQTYRSLGGPSPISRIEWKDGHVYVGDTATLTPLTACRGFGATCFDEGGLAEEISRGRLPSRAQIEDRDGRAEGVIAFDVVIAPGEATDVYVECRRRRRHSPISMGREVATPVSDLREPALRLQAAFDAWQVALPAPHASGPVGPVAALEAAATAMAHILECRDGAALQPGPRRYSRSWIRDGAIMAAALLRGGRPDAARAFVEWYAQFQREDGFVPCCVDRDGVDPLVEHDSHGQLIYAVAEVYRFTRDRDFARAHWSHCEKAAQCIEALRETRRTPEFEGDDRRACYGLLPESVSHEGYLAQPVHSYWDDIWALRGLRDASYLAHELDLPADSDRWRAAAADLAAATAKSITEVMRERNLSTVPASVEWADFDPTAIAGAISLVGATHLFPHDALARTFDQYMTGLRARHSGTMAWINFSPYEVRIVGALTLLGRRDDALELLIAMLAARRPAAWRQWPEIVWRDMESPAHLGDLPHCWIGAEYMIALRTMIVYEREHDESLVLGAGLRREWLDSTPSLEVKGLPTWYGTLDLAIGRHDDGYRIRVRGAKPPGGFVAMLPEGCVATIEVEQ